MGSGRSSRKGILVGLVLMSLMTMMRGAFAPHELERVEEDEEQIMRQEQQQRDQEETRR